MASMLAPKDVPREWRAPWALLLLIATVGGFWLGAVTFVRSEARAEARAVMSEELAQRILADATAAAKQAAKEAVQEVVAETARKLEAHVARDDQRHVDEDRRLERLEDPRRR